MTANLRELRDRVGLTQAQVAERMGIAQGEVSKLERRRDLKASTLQRYIEALGGELELNVKSPSFNGHVRFDHVGLAHAQGSRPMTCRTCRAQVAAAATR